MGKPTYDAVLFGERPLLEPCEVAEPSSSSSEDLAFGRVYTPAHLVDFVLNLSGYGMAADPVTVLDPACGPGAFLVGTVKQLAAQVTRDGLSLDSAPGHAALAKRVEATIFGVDVDLTACSEAREAVRSAVQQLSPGPLPNDFFEDNVRLADFLLDGDVDTLGPAEGFDYVVGNPPYVAATRIPAVYKEALRRRFSTATGRLDLYTLFMERAIELLRPGGRLSFITPNKYFASHSAGLLRQYLTESGGIIRLANFSSHRVFDDAATVPCVTVFERGLTAGETEVLECGDQPDVRGTLPILAKSTVEIAPGRATWHVGQPALHSLAQRMSNGSLPLAAFVSRVSAGIATGRDEIFVRPPSELDVEPELLRPAVRGRDLAPHRIASSNLALLLPYQFSPRGPELIDLDEYPRARAHLAQYERELRERHCVRVWGKAWWDLHDPIGCDLSRVEKILVPDVAASNRFALDDGHLCPLHSAYYIVPRAIDSRYLVALLNSKPIEFMIRLRAPVVKDGFSRYRKQFLMQLPVPLAEGEARASMITAALAADTDLADGIAAELFGLTSTELTAIDDYLRQRADARRVASTS